MEIVEFKKEKIRELVKRSQIDVNHIINDVQSIINKVQSGGDLALEYYTSKFDKVDLKNFKVSKKEIDHSYYNLDPEIIESLKKAARNIKKFHQAQVPSEWSMEVDSGIKAGQIIRPIE
ncbi:MAG: histidinol dehydrogenase, partial [Methanobacterium sp.]|nr:histidinol dehydrogenase [Methanobacterium sp.]